MSNSQRSSKTMGFSRALSDWCREPHKLGHLLGFTKLTPDHDQWIHLFLKKEHGPIRVLQAHRGSYKTTCGLVAMLLLMMIHPNFRVLIARKSEKMAIKLVGALQRMFQSELVRAWFFAAHKVYSLETDKWSASAIRLAVNTRLSPEPSFTAVGTMTSQTGDHYDYIWSDDIITIADRYSQKERDATKNYIHELENIIEPRGIRMFSGTPWHEMDGFSLLEALGIKIHRFPIGSMRLAEFTPEMIAERKKRTPRSLWAANMELKHERDSNPEFPDPIYEVCPDTELALYMFIDGAFGGNDNVAIWIGGEHNGLFYLTHSKMYGNSIADHWEDIEAMYNAMNLRLIVYEDNAAQRLIGDRLTDMRLPNKGITSSTNKYGRITNTLKPLWDRLRFDPSLQPGFDEPEEFTEESVPNPLQQVLDYNSEAQQDDSPDALSALIRYLAGYTEADVQDLLDIQNELLR